MAAWLLRRNTSLVKQFFGTNLLRLMTISCKEYQQKIELVHFVWIMNHGIW